MKRIIFWVILGMAIYNLISIAIIEAKAETVEVEPGLYMDVPQETIEAEEVPEPTEAEEVPEPTEAEEVPETTEDEQVSETTEAEQVPETTEAEAVPETTEDEAVPETTEAQPDERLDYLKNIHEDNQKIMISIWTLTGLTLGTKLISRMFGNG